MLTTIAGKFLKIEWMVPLLISIGGACVSGYVGYQHTKERVTVVETQQNISAKDIDRVEHKVDHLDDKLDEKTDMLQQDINGVKKEIGDVKNILLEDRRYNRGSDR